MEKDDPVTRRSVIATAGTAGLALFGCPVEVARAESPAEPRGEGFPSVAASCCCCHKCVGEVGPFAELAEGLYICYPCVRLSTAVIEQECERRGTPLKEYHE